MRSSPTSFIPWGRRLMRPAIIPSLAGGVWCFEEKSRGISLVVIALVCACFFGRIFFLISFSCLRIFSVFRRKAPVQAAQSSSRRDRAVLWGPGEARWTCERNWDERQARCKAVHVVLRSITAGSLVTPTRLVQDPGSYSFVICQCPPLSRPLSYSLMGQWDQQSLNTVPLSGAFLCAFVR